MSETIFALSSGAAPAGIGVIRISGPAARDALMRLGARVSPPRRASLMSLRDGDGVLLDRAMVLWLPGPTTVTGEDMAELHCHGGRAVIAAVEAALASMPGLRPAAPGEFTRRAFGHGRIDLAEAEGLADLLSAETEFQRRAAMAMTGGDLSRAAGDWRGRVLLAGAEVEAVLDFADEDDVASLSADFTMRLSALQSEIATWLARPRAEILREGFRVVIAGPPNVGKSTLFNALVESDAAITAPVAGTTRDVLERPVAIDGVPFTFLDTAGLRSDTQDAIEAIGISRARAAVGTADLVLWLGPEGEGPTDAWEIAARCDAADARPKRNARHSVSARTGEGIDALLTDLALTARHAMPRPGDAALNTRQHRLLRSAADALVDAAASANPLIAAEGLRAARVAFDALLGHASTEDMLDTLFGRFCIGK